MPDKYLDEEFQLEFPILAESDQKNDKFSRYKKIRAKLNEASSSISKKDTFPSYFNPSMSQGTPTSAISVNYPRAFGEDAENSKIDFKMLKNAVSTGNSANVITKTTELKNGDKVTINPPTNPSSGISTY